MNVWWASTRADDGAWGWVSEVYFKGGDENDPDAGLFKPGPVTCFNCGRSCCRRGGAGA